ncbi:MAG: sensor histidine kinase [Solirubrobacteraceae bacterium]
MDARAIRTVRVAGRARAARWVRTVRTASAERTATLLDWVPVGLLPPVLIADAAISSRPIGITGIIAAIIASLPLVLRRRLSFPQLAPLLVAGIVLVMWRLHPGSTVVLIPMVALLELARRGDRRHSLWVAVGVIPCVAVGVAPFVPDAAEFAQVGIRNVAFCLLAIAAGEITRSRDESAERDAAAREEAALRRVGEERLRIAQEVHDVVAHAMVAINVQAGVAAHLIGGDPDHARESLLQIKRASGEALSDLRRTLGVLRDPEHGAPIGVPAAPVTPATAPVGPAVGLHHLEELAGSLRAAGVAVSIDVDPFVGVPAPVHAAGYRIVQEALTNVLRHAHASTVRILVRREDVAVRIEVTDDGHGTSAAQDGSGHGLRGMRERATALGGTLESGPDPDGGWRVRASLPVATPVETGA